MAGGVQRLGWRAPGRLVVQCQVLRLLVVMRIWGAVVMPETRAETLTPEIAAQLLQRNHHNRRLNPVRVRLLADAISRGEWEFNGATIVLDPSGEILDGQHRLAAIVKANESIVTLVIHGVQRAAQETMDTGKPRSLADILSIRGEKRTNVLASAIRSVAAYEMVGIPVIEWAPVTMITSQQGLALLERHPGLRESSEAHRFLSSHLLPRPTGVHYLFSLSDIEGADAFFRELRTGEGLEEGNPILLLRNRLTKEAVRGSSQTRPIVKLALAVRAWNAWMAGETLSLLKWAPGGARPERFPRIEGCPILPAKDKR